MEPVAAQIFSSSRLSHLDPNGLPDLGRFVLLPIEQLGVRCWRFRRRIDGFAIQIDPASGSVWVQVVM